MEAYNIQNSLDEYSAAREQFDTLVDGLQSGAMMEAEHGEVEKYLFKGGMELLRRMIQGYMDALSTAEKPRNSMKGSDGVERTHRRCGCERPLETVFGEVTVRRMGYGYPGYESVYPLDASLNLPPDKYSHGLQEILSNESAKGSFDEAVKAVKKLTGGAVPKRQAEALTPKITADFEAFYAKRAVENPEDTTDILAMTTDGKGVVMREEALREATQRAAQRSRKKQKGSRLKPGEKQNRKRMATVTAVYSVERNLRTPEEIMNEGSDNVAEKSPRPKPRNKRVAASVKKSQEHAIDEMFLEA